MERGWLLACAGLGILFGIVFAIFPWIDLSAARFFFDQTGDRFPVAHSYDWNVVRDVANWISLLLLAPAVFALARKIVFPTTKMLVAPSVVVFLIGSFILGPGLTTNFVLKDHWGRPRPHQVQQFAGAADFKPWWQPGGACERNCSFVSGEASKAYWAVAPASLAPPPIRPLAMAGAVTFGTAVGGLRVVFGRHFVSDVIFAGLLTIAIVMALYYLLISPVRRNDARFEKAIERFALGLHRNIGGLLSGAGTVMARTGSTLRQTGHHLNRREV